MQVLEKILQEIEERINDMVSEAGECEEMEEHTEAEVIDHTISGLNIETSIIRSHMEDDGWIPVGERLPEDDTDLEVTLADGARHIAWLGNKGNWYDSLCGYNSEKVDVIAWKEASAPYQPREGKNP